MKCLESFLVFDLERKSHQTDNDMKADIFLSLERANDHVHMF